MSTLATVSVHLGALDESLLRPHDLYVCIRPTPPDLHLPINVPIEKTGSTIQLCAVWRSATSLTEVNYRPLNSNTREGLTPIALEMLAEELPHLLQTLLVGVEHAINRVPLDDLTFFHGPGGPASPDLIGNQQLNGYDSMSSGHTKLLLSPMGSPKCGLKRRELINKNKVNNKYALKRMSSNKSETKSIADPMEQPISPQQMEASTEPLSTLPLFCLGRSFPHIDSDEDSGDDGSTMRSESGKFS